jgi:hypothetical protein
MVMVPPGLLLGNTTAGQTTLPGASLVLKIFSLRNWDEQIELAPTAQSSNPEKPTALLH